MSLKYTDEAFIREFIKVAEMPKWGQAAPVSTDPYAPTAPTSTDPEPALAPDPFRDRAPVHADPYAPNPTQAPAPNAATARQIHAIAQKLAQNLQQSAAGITAPRADAEMYLKDVLDLPSLVNFLYKNMIQYNGQYVVSKQEPAAGQENNFVPYTEGLAVGNTKIYINKAALIGYLHSLQQQANDPKNPNALLSATLTKLIDNAETELKITVPKASPATHEMSEKEQAAISDNTPLDSLDTMVYVDGPMMPARDQGNIIIRPKMLKSKPEFDNLVKVLQVVKDKKQVPYEDDNIYCYVIGVLFARARSYNFRRGEPLDKHYLDLITQLASQYQCALPQTGQAGEKSEYQQAAYRPGQPLNAQQLQALAPISVEYPLHRDLIDFEGIRNWVNGYQQILGASFKDSSDAPLVASVLDQVNGIINGFGLPHQSLTDNAVDIYRDIFNLASKTRTRQEAGYVPAQYVNDISALLVSLERLLFSFKKKYYTSMPDDWRSKLDQQVGDVNSLVEDNKRRVAQWIAQMPQAMKQVIERGQ
jgi:hypothetical protein